MREKLQALPVGELREIAKANGIKSVSILRKQQLIDMILEVTQRNEKKEESEKTEESVKGSDEDKQETAREQKNTGENGRHRKRHHSDNLEHRDEVPQENGVTRTGILEVMPDGFGFIRCDNYLPGEDDVYVAPSQIKRFQLKTGDFITGRVREKRENEKFGALYYVDMVNGESLDKVLKRPNFEELTPIFPNERLHLETDGHSTAMRIVDIVSPIGKGQRGMIVSPPKAGKTTLLKETAKAVLKNNPEMEMIILLIDERPEEVTDIKEAIQGDNVEVIYSTFDELPEHHKRVSEMVIERAKRLVEHGKDVIILLDSITRLARAYNMTVPPSGRTLSGGLDPAALHMPKRFFGAARNMREGGSLTVLATALVNTGSKMDDVVYEEFKGTGNMELVLDRKLSEKRIFPAIDITQSGTRREDLLLNADELGASYIIRNEMNGMRKEDAVEQILNLFARTKSNEEFIEKVGKIRTNYNR
ncbi:MAG: transcription termination factor Rho [Eubacterium sp.]|mgnify:CR=1|jgi:transcription termination factor Rho|nr:transcription termination factor Rho [Eubacterium sp.]